MQSNFSRLCAMARNEIIVPAVPLSSIHRGLERQYPHQSFRWGFRAAAVAMLSIMTVAAAAEMYAHAHVFLNTKSGLGPIIAADSGAINLHATPAAVRAAAQQLDFPVILPAGLPVGTTPFQLVVGGKSTMWLTYNLPGARRRSDHLLYVLLANERDVVNLKGGRLPAEKGRMLSMPRHLNEMRIWQLGSEVVVVAGNNITAQELQNMERAMETQFAQRTKK